VTKLVLLAKITLVACLYTLISGIAHSQQIEPVRLQTVIQRVCLGDTVRQKIASTTEVIERYACKVTPDGPNIRIRFFDTGPCLTFLRKAVDRKGDPITTIQSVDVVAYQCGPGEQYLP